MQGQLSPRLHGSPFSECDSGLWQAAGAVVEDEAADNAAAAGAEGQLVGEEEEGWQIHADDAAGSGGSERRHVDKSRRTEATAEVLGAEAGKMSSAGSWEALLEVASGSERPAVDRAADMEDSCW